MPMTTTSVVSWKMPIAMLTKGGITARSACGSTTSRYAESERRSA